MSNIADIVFAPHVPWLVIAGLAGAAALVLAYGATRGEPSWAWRVLALGAGLTALTNPSLIAEQRETLPDVAVIIVDDSQSQRIGDRASQTERAFAAVESRLARHKSLDVRIVRVANRSAVSQGSVPTAEGTRLFTALDRALSYTPRERFAGAILITDGQVHDAPNDATAALLGGPIHTLLTGQVGERDRRVVIERAPSYGIVGKTLELALRVEDTGDAPGRPDRLARVTLRRDGGEAVVHGVPVGDSRTVPFVLNHGSQTVLEIEAEPGANELTLQNNRAVVVVNGVRDRLRVLLVSGAPHPGGRTWRNLLKADPAVDLVHFTILRPPEKQDGTPVRELSLIAFPVRELFEVKLKEFDLIIFDRYRRRGVLPQSYLDNVVDYVRDGGAILEAAGPAYATPLSMYNTPLARVLPGEPTGRVYRQGFRPLLSELGRRHPVTADLPGAAEDEPHWGRWFRLMETRSLRGTVLMNGAADKPLLIVDRFEEGRVAQILSDHAWLWTRGFEGGGPQAELLRRLAHWLMREPDLEEEQLRATVDGARLDIVRRSLTPGASTVTVTSPSGAMQAVKLDDKPKGYAGASIAIGEVGLYRLSDGTLTAVAAVGALNPKEFADVRATDRYLGPIAKATGGRVTWLGRDGVPDIRRARREHDAAGRGWIGLYRNERYLVTGVDQLPLLPAVLVLALMLGGLALAWHREGR